MGDDWDADDWEAEDFKPKLTPASAVKGGAEFDTKGAAILAKVAEPDASKFQDEDEAADEEDEAAKHAVPKSQPKKKEEKKYEDKVAHVDQQPLDDPVEEKLRLQRLVEQADFLAARDLFGGTSAEKPIDDVLPKSVKEFEDFAERIANRYVVPHKDSKPYKAFLKALLKATIAPLTSEDTKDLETCIAGIRADKVKAEKAAALAKKGGKKTLNLGKSGGTGGLDDYQFEALDDDNGDFM